MIIFKLFVWIILSDTFVQVNVSFAQNGFFGNFHNVIIEKYPLPLFLYVSNIMPMSGGFS